MGYMEDSGFMLRFTCFLGVRDTKSSSCLTFEAVVGSTWRFMGRSKYCYK